MKSIKKCAACGVDPEFFQTTSGLFGIRCKTPNCCLSMSVPQQREDWAIDNWNGLQSRYEDFKTLFEKRRDGVLLQLEKYPCPNCHKPPKVEIIGWSQAVYCDCGFIQKPESRSCINLSLSIEAWIDSCESVKRRKS